MTIVASILGVLLIVALLWSWHLRKELQAERAYSQRRDTALVNESLPPLFLATAAAIESGLLLLDRNHRIRFANHALHELLKLGDQLVEGQSLITVLRDYQTDALIKMAIETGEPQSSTLQPVLSPLTLRITCYPLPEIESYAAIVLLRDITQIAQLERARRELVANVSHELRTPLASMKLLVETLQNSPPAPIARRMLGQIDSELDSMTQLVDELRELSQIESGRMVITLQPVDLAAVIGRAVERIRQQAERHNLQLVTNLDGELPPALLDSERMGQVLLNLLSNAVKFTPEGGSITVGARAIGAATVEPHSRLEHELLRTGLDRALLVTIRDTGIGIPPQDVERVFERFYKVDRARTRHSSGTGLGLAIAKHLVERHGGRIWTESREGAGSTFSILLPAA